MIFSATVKLAGIRRMRVKGTASVNAVPGAPAYTS